MKKSILSIVFLCFLLSLPSIYSPAAKKKTQPKDFAGIFIESEDLKEEKPLQMTELSIDVKIIGTLAVTTLEMNFYNDTNRVLEGNLSFPLAEGERVSRFAMDVNGSLREGVVVEKTKARQVFEAIERSQVDPALLEQTKGNHFNARVYPIPAKGTKKILIAYESQLFSTSKGLSYYLPLGFPDKIDNVSIKMEVFQQNEKPLLQNNNYQTIDFKKSGQSYISEYQVQNALLKNPISFIVPEEIQKESVFIESALQDTYFYLNVIPNKVSMEKKLPKKIALYWDASMSALNKKLDKEFALLDSYFNKIGSLEVSLTVFRNQPEEPVTFKIQNGDWSKLKETLKKLPYDGATQLGALDFNKTSADEIILSTDGISNFGEKEIKIGKIPVTVINSQTTAEHSYLNYIAQASGGSYINLARIDVKEAFKQITSQLYSFISAEYDEKSVKQTYPSIPTAILNDFTLAGKMVKDQAEIKLNFGFGSDIKYSKTIKLNKNKNKTNSNLVQRIWAMKKIAELDMQFEKNEAEITKLAKTFSVVTRNTSLLILERLDDYVRYKVVPPKDLQKEYFEIVGRIDKEIKQKETSNIEYVIGLLKTREDWYKKDFPMGPIPKKEVPDKKEMESERSRSLRMEDRMVDREARAESVAESRPSAGKARAKKSAKADLAKDASGADEEEDAKASISLKKWTPDVPYLKELNEASESQWYSVYLKLRKEYQSSSAFYLDVADFFIEKKQKTLALRILSNIAEMQLENPALLRILAHRLEQIKEFSLAISVFKDILKMREEEPQSYRDLGLAYASNKQNQEAIEKLYHVVRNQWDSRFPEIQIIALEEMNAIIATSEKPLNTEGIDKRLIKNMPLDLRVTLSWDADNCDMDLWVLDANGEKSYYGYQLSYMGGLMSRDFTRGYGPEEYLLKKAKPGKYVIQINYYGNTQQILAGATTVQVKLFTHFGKKKQKTEEITLRLKDQREVITVGEFEFKK